MKRTARVISGLIVLGLFLCDAGSQAAYSQDPTLPGPFAVTREEYDFGDTAFTPPGFPGPVEMRGSAHYPTNWTGAPLPLIVFLHGRAYAFRVRARLRSCGPARCPVSQSRVTRVTTTSHRRWRATGIW